MPGPIWLDESRGLTCYVNVGNDMSSCEKWGNNTFKQNMHVYLKDLFFMFYAKFVKSWFWHVSTNERTDIIEFEK